MKPNSFNETNEHLAVNQTSWRERLANWVQQSTDDQEPLHQIGQIQSQGCMLVLDPLANLQIVQASLNTTTYLGVEPAQLVGNTLGTVMTPETVDSIQTAIANPELTAIHTHTCKLRTCRQQPKSPYATLSGELNRSGSWFLLELEPFSPLTLPQFQALHHQLTGMMMRIRQAPDIDSLYTTTCQEVARLTGFDRVMIYQFEPDHTGVVRAEVMQGQQESYVGLHYPAADIPTTARSLFCQKIVRLIQDVTTEPIDLWWNEAHISPQEIDLTHATLRSPSACHRQYLKNMGVHASLTIALTDQEGLWGLIACHHYRSRWLSGEVRKMCELIAQLVSSELRLQQSYAFRHDQTRIQQIENTLYRDLSQNPVQAMQVLHQHRHQLLDLIPADGLVIRVDQTLESVGVVPTPQEVEALLAWAIAEHQSGLYHTETLRRDYPAATAYQLPVSGVCVLSVVLESFSYQVAWLRLEQTYAINWGGNPEDVLAPGQTPNEGNLPLRLSPRHSFRRWQELVDGQSLPWQASELKTAQELRHSLLLTALNQSHLILEHALQRANEASTAKNEFLANMSHEIRTPMNAILGFTQLLEITTLTHKQQRYIDSINHGGEQLLAIINDILDLAKLESGELQLHHEQFHLPSVLENLQQLLSPSVQHSAIEISLQISPDVPIWLGGPLPRLEQVLMNLMQNAIKFTEQGTVTLHVQQVKPTVLPLNEHHRQQTLLYFAVEDTGIGIDPVDQSHIFDTFTQVDSSTNRRYEGTGLGLAICRKIVQLMGGEIGVESELAVGSRFWLTVPLAVISDTVTPLQWPENSASNVLLPSIGQILLVEDNTLNQELAIAMLASLGLTVDHVEDGQTALVKMQEQFYDLVLMDCHLPKLSGYDATAQFRKLAATPTQQTIIIGMTAYAMTGDREKCLEAGMDDYLSKPFKLLDLQALLLKWFS